MSVAAWETLLQNCTVGARVQVGDHIVAMVPQQPEALESMPASYREVVIVFDPRSEVTERQVTCDRRTRLQVLRSCARTFGALRQSGWSYSLYDGSIVMNMYLQFENPLQSQLQ